MSFDLNLVQRTYSTSLRYINERVKEKRALLRFQIMTFADTCTHSVPIFNVPATFVLLFPSCGPGRLDLTVWQDRYSYINSYTIIESQISHEKAK